MTKEKEGTLRAPWAWLGSARAVAPPVIHRRSRRDGWRVARGRPGALAHWGMLVALLLGSMPSPPTTIPDLFAFAVAEGKAPGKRGHPEAAARDAERSALARQIDGLLAEEPGVYGIIVADTKGSIAYERNADLPFVAASLYKLPVMVAVFQAERDGLLAFDEGIVAGDTGWTTIAAAVAAMITASNNEAALALIDRVGVAAVNRAAADLGLHHTRLGVDPASLAGWALPLAADPDALPGDSAADRAVAFVWAAAPAANGWPDVTTPRDTAHFFQRLLDRDVVDRRASKAMLRLLGHQTINDRFPALLPPSTEIAHKTGNLPGVVHDAGVVFAPAGPVILVALAEDVPDEAHAAALLQRLARLVYDHYGGGARPSTHRCCQPTP